MVFWAGGWPLCYYYPYSGYVEYIPSTTYYAAPPVSADTQINYTYYDLGLQWGQDLRGALAQWDEFVKYVRDYIVNAPALALDEFRRGFEAGYGGNSTAVFENALEQARG